MLKTTVALPLKTCRHRFLQWRQCFTEDIFKHSSIAFVDQALLSVTNFTVGLLLIRQSADAHYALYVLSYAAILLVVSLQSAIVTTQMSVLAPRYGTEHRLRFIGALGTGQYLIWLPLCGLTLLLSRQVAVWAGHTALVQVIAIVTLAVLLREFMRRALFVYSLPWRVLAVDIFYATVLLGTVYTLTPSSSAPAIATMAAMGGASLMAGILGYVLFTNRLGWNWCWELGSLSTTWKNGKWALLGTIVTWLQNHGFLYLLSSLQETEAVVNVSATRLLLMPIVVMITSVGLVLKPRGASWLASGNRSLLFRATAGLTIAAVVVAVAYTAVLLAGHEFITSVVLKKTVTDIDLLLLLWGMVFLIQLVRTNISIVFQIFQHFNILFYIGFITAMISLSTGYWAIRSFGAIGSLLGLIIGELTCLISLLVVCVYYQRQQGPSAHKD